MKKTRRQQIRSQSGRKVAIVTGGAQGIGKAITQRFLQHKVQVVIADSDAQAGAETVKEFKSLGEAIYVKTNVSQEKDIKRLLAQTIRRFKRVDFLINNAGIFIEKKFTKLSFKEWQRILGINLTGIFLCAKYAASYLQKSHGSIVNIASTRALMSEPNTEVYAASKGGIVALTHALAMSLGPEIRVNCISPGWIETSEWKKSSKRHRAKLSSADLKQHPVGRVGKPEDIAAMVWYLVSPEAGFITGANFIVDGGMTRKMIYV